MTIKPRTIGELREAGYTPLAVKEELERNLIKAMQSGEELFPGIQGFGETVIPQIINAILSHHDIVLLGEKGQAKTRIMRALIRFLDDEIPVIAGCEINDSPFEPICQSCKSKIAEHGEIVEIEWLQRDKRYGERLSPGTKIADLIGDLDPAKVAGGAPLASENALSFGLIPRMNRGIFAINELPDLEYLIQVSLFNILEERDVQIRGYPIRFPLDVALIFSANPDEYSRSGKIISQLKDRIGAEIKTHYPLSRDVGIKIIEQEAKVDVGEAHSLKVPLFMKEIVEQITIEARSSPYVNQKSGVSARLSITNYETLVANSRRRSITLGEKIVCPRISDINYLYTSSSGKIELDPFREESLSEHQVIGRVIESAIEKVFLERFEGAALDEMSVGVSGGKNIEVGDMVPSVDYKKIISDFTQLWEPVHELGGDEGDEVRASALEFVLEGLYLSGRLSRKKIGEMASYRGKA
ncbi:Magnesium chelatase, subunit ChlI [hydrothermal vent metagenome]|uniref:Magnesium chelatase, subunit ChlI n=1 Tax=hydrothermal vent metagenome TaxID=652676 RepID=A0A3B1C0X8_9ZZZZ